MTLQMRIAAAIEAVEQEREFLREGWGSRVELRKAEAALEMVRWEAALRV